MDLKDLKSAWDAYSSQEVDKHRLGKENLHDLLKKRSKTIVDRIDRNIRIGMIVVLVFIVYILLDHLFLSMIYSKMIVKEVVNSPKWLFGLDVFSNTLIITTYLYFAIRYIRIKRSFSIDLQLKDLLNAILNTMNTYRRAFYLAVIFMLVDMVLNFGAGLYLGVKMQTDSLDGGLGNLTISKILLIIAVGLVILIPLIVLVFFALRWGFNKLYGRYLIQLNETLQELDESDDEE